MLIRTKTAKGYFEENEFDNILILFDVSLNFLFNTNEKMGDD